MKKLIYFIFLISISCFSIAQNTKIDSLQTLLNAAKDDTTRLRLYLALAEECDMKDNLKYGTAAVTLADNLLSKTNDEQVRKPILKRKARAFYFIAIFYSDRRDTSKIREYYQKQLSIWQEIKDSLRIIQTLGAFGEYYKGLGNIPKSITYYQHALAIARAWNNKKQIAICLYQMGFLYSEQDYKPQALENFQKGLALLYELKDTVFIIRAHVEIGRLYNALHDTTNALKCFNKALLLIKTDSKQIREYHIYRQIGDMYKNNNALKQALFYYKKTLSKAEEENNRDMIFSVLNRIGNTYRDLSDYDKALGYVERGLRIAEETKSESNIAWSYASLAKIYGKQKNYKKGKYYIDKALALMKKQGNVSDVCEIEQLCAKSDSLNGNYKEAYGHYQQYIMLRDKLNSKELSKAAANEKFQEEADKQKAEQEKLDAIALEQKKRQQFIIYGVAGVLLIVLVFSISLFRRFKITQKQKVVIEQQKHLVEEHQKEIVDSITYAKRLQQAILPTVEAVQEHLPNSFIYYQPKDIVAGDFYWMHTTKDYIFIAAADCTGHGVPGAMVSVVCSNALNRAVNEFKLEDTGHILDKTRDLVIETFEKSDSAVKDGMDISLLRIQNINGEHKEVQWSGANNSLWYVTNNELIEVKADKQPIGKYSDPSPFTANNFNFSASVSFYLFSDGYADQFSANDKKLMKKKFKEIVLSIQNKSMWEQGNHLEKVHVDWKGNMEQTDDVLVIGVKI